MRLAFEGQIRNKTDWIKKKKKKKEHGVLHIKKKNNSIEQRILQWEQVVPCVYNSNVIFSRNPK